MPVDVEQAGGACGAFVGDQQQRGNRFDSVQVEDQALQGVAVVFFRRQNRGRAGLVAPRQISQQAPEFLSPPGLKSGEFRGSFLEMGFA